MNSKAITTTSILAILTGTSVGVIAILVWSYQSELSDATDTALLALFTLAVAAGTAWSAYASLRLAKAAEIETKVIIKPSVGIRYVYRLDTGADVAYVQVKNVGAGLANSAYLTVKIPGATFEAPKLGKRSMIGIGDSRRFKFDVQEQVKQMYVRVDYTDSLGNPYHNEIEEADIRTRHRHPSTN